jgi:hypothetical protein
MRTGSEQAKVFLVGPGRPTGRLGPAGRCNSEVATADELIVIERLWLDGRYLKPKELLAD